jgi:hypothetical protein
MGNLGKLASAEKPLPAFPEVSHGWAPPLVMVAIALWKGADHHPAGVVIGVRLGELLKGNPES